MHIRRIEIENIRAIKHLIWELPEEQNGAGWHVILGDNGSGKTSFVRAVSYACLQPAEKGYLQINTFRWRRDSKSQAYSKLTVKFNRSQFNFENVILSASPDDAETFVTEPVNHSQYYISLIKSFFIISFGPHRKFSGTAPEDSVSPYEFPGVSRHVTAFSETAGLTEALPWLQKLRFQELENDTIATQTLKRVREFVNQTGFLAHDAKITEVSSKGVRIEDANGNVVPVEEVSDGYRSVLSLTFELIRQLVDCFGVDKVFDPEDATKIIAPGVVQIDEVDAHLHPTWQHRIGEWFTTHFPNIQFIVTTHSPIICQAADTVFKLPTPGTDEVGAFVTGNDLLRLKYGSVSEAYGTGVFGVGVERSEEAKGLLEELAALNIKELDDDLTDEEIERQEFLRGLFPSSASVGLSRRRAR